MQVTPQTVRDLFVYEPETGRLVRRRTTSSRAAAGAVAGSLSLSGYLTIRIGPDAYQAHRLIWLHVHGEWPSGDIDHINGIKTDNRIANLRDVSRSVNNQNKRATANNRTGLLGVYLHKASGLYAGRIKLRGKTHSCGYFKTPEEAHAAYLAAKRAMHEGCTI